MTCVQLAEQLHQIICEGNYPEVRNLLDHVVDPRALQEVEEQFSDRDPVVCAIDNNKETIACYLVEKGFTILNEYQFPDKTCDHWCYSDHGDIRCPVSAYDARDLAHTRGLLKVRDLIDDIRKCRRKPGDGLQQAPTPLIEREPSPVKKERKSAMSSRLKKSQGVGDIARSHIQNLGPDYKDMNGNSLLHQFVEGDVTVLYALASGGVPVNSQNKNGDTALHLSVRSGQIGATESLLQCGADFSIRNKLGLTPLDESNGKLKELLNRYKPGLVQAILDGNTTAVGRLIDQWCNVNAVVKEGKTVLEYARSLSGKIPTILKCYNDLKSFQPTSELIHAVLADDLASAKTVLKTKKSCIVNKGFKGPQGTTPLACAIKCNNLEMVKLLVEHDAKIAVRVKEREEDECRDTMPLIMKALSPKEHLDVAKYLHACARLEAAEKDKDGNTLLLRAIQDGCSVKCIEWLINDMLGQNLVERTKNGLTPRELAFSLGKHDIVQAIDKIVIRLVGFQFVRTLVACFYGFANFQIKDSETGEALLQVAMEIGSEEDMFAISHCSEIEDMAVQLFHAAARGDVAQVEKLNTAEYVDKNGYTALIRAVVFNQLPVAEKLIIMRPVLKSIPDNCNRYPLHYAYAMPENIGRPFVELFLQRNPEDIEKKKDWLGREAAEYQAMRNTPEVLDMLNKARTLDAYGKPGPPLAPVLINGV
ncbi:uncharacterized protein LOC106159684 [Lingula anatina]|uniref:Uncharacterized protein LOC106159684 n=1 Tax=Lingula anatina TaxID=7574 RepID=A0A1S3HZS4_LINAN|nr:uncharacterized protein LOC106159684 [Lingula anatina]XP_013391515.1 uncharacterized protein LOC106159684 [Lingula anatina]XP_013391516.1 uncharacterized protein LOC106159684 [Lingula anatina]XP_013391517.1 uncharacterized protein LOC106159684 [Lingula anatina]|eukprot:XP_013391514.1 uncharacterized protein LOC106159684 [Lingula anatina]